MNHEAKRLLACMVPVRVDAASPNRHGRSRHNFAARDKSLAARTAYRFRRRFLFYALKNSLDETETAL
jgi:hypothetical protein